MKLSALQQSYLDRRNNSFRGSSPIDSSGEISGKSPAEIFWLLIHASCCIVSILLGFRFSRVAFFFLFAATTTTTISNYLVTFRGGAGEVSVQLGVHSALVSSPVAKSEPPPAANLTGHAGGGSRVVVGRHGIRIRPWPHPNPEEVMNAHRIMERVKREQRAVFGLKTKPLPGAIASSSLPGATVPSSPPLHGCRACVCVLGEKGEEEED